MVIFVFIEYSYLLAYNSHSYVFIFTDTLQARPIGKRLYSVSGKADEVLSWEKMGIDIGVPAGVISLGGFCDIAVVAVLSGDFIFPDNSIPVSGVFAVGTSCALEKPLTIKLQHCVKISTEEDTGAMTFTKAEHSGKSPPYVFEECGGGVFTPGAQYASLDCQSFTLIAIVRRMRAWITGQPDSSIKYRAQVMYSKPSSGRYIVYLVVVKNTNSLVQVSHSRLYMQHPLILYLWLK